MATDWETGFGRFNWVLWKNILIGIFGVGALIFGSESAIRDIVKLYQPQTDDPLLLSNLTATATTILSP